MMIGGVSESVRGDFRPAAAADTSPPQVCPPDHGRASSRARVADAQGTLRLPASL